MSKWNELCLAEVIPWVVGNLNDRKFLGNIVTKHAVPLAVLLTTMKRSV